MSNPVAIAGIHSVRAALKHGGELVSEVWLERRRRDRRLAQLTELAREAGVTVRPVTRDQLDGASEGANHQGVLAWARTSVALGEKDLADVLDKAQGSPFLLILDGVQDPHNLGACLRTASGAGVTAVIAPVKGACGITDTVRDVSCGGADDVPFLKVKNIGMTLRRFRDQSIQIVGTSDQGNDQLYGVDFTKPTALVLGSEGWGLRKVTGDLCDELIRIPMAGTVDCLNVSVSAGVCLYEAVRQRL